MLKWVKLYGTATGTSMTITGTNKCYGELVAVQWIDGTFTDGVDAVLSVVSDNDAADYTLLTLTDANSDAWYYPQSPVHDNAGTAVTFDNTNEIYTRQVIAGQLKLVVTSIVAAEVGGCIVYYK